MSTSRVLLVTLLSFGAVACKGDTGPAGPPGDQGNPGPTGSDGTPAPTTGTLTGTITDGVKGDALADVTVTAADAGGTTLATATTGADGAFSIIVTAGPVDLSFAKPLYTAPGVLHAGVGVGQTVHFGVTMNEAATGKPSVLIAVAGDDFGYGATVTLDATASDPNNDPLSYTWTNATAPALGSVTGSGATGTVTMPTMTEAFAYRPDATNPGQFISGYTIEDRFGVIPITTDTRGQMTVSVKASDGRGQSTTASLTLNAASVSDGLKNVSLGRRVYLNSGHDAGNSWTITPPAGSVAALTDDASRTPSFVADKSGVYTIGEGASSMTIAVGPYYGALEVDPSGSVVPNSTCKLCHNDAIAPDMFTPWLATGHATMFQNGINGDISDHYTGACIGCHTVGYDIGIDGNGFDDAAKAAGWTFPATLDAANWTNMAENYPSVVKLANIQCESCHGPNDPEAHGAGHFQEAGWDPLKSPRISYSAEVCATCHAAGAHHLYSEWSTKDPVTGMGHSNRADTRLAASATGLNSSCGRCHAAQGYAMYADLLKQGKVTLASVPAAKLALVTPANVEPVTCVACHDPHDATNPNQLRFYGDTPNTPAGFAGHGMGKGAVCLTCHNSRNGSITGSDSLTFLHEDTDTYSGGNPNSYSAPHQADQGDVFEGHNAYFMGANMPMLSKHAAVADTCVGCHMTNNPKGYLSHGTPTASGHLFRIESGDKAALCSKCHGSTVDGEGIQAQVESQLVALNVKMGSAFKTKVATTLGNQFLVRAYDEATDYYTSTSSSSANFLVDTTANAIDDVKIEEIHGQVGLAITLHNAITIPYVTGTGAPAPKTTNTFGVQLGSVKDNTSAHAAVYALTGNYIKAGWNYFLVEGDQSLGLHNPSFVTAVLNTTLAKDLTN